MFGISTDMVDIVELIFDGCSFCFCLFRGRGLTDLVFLTGIIFGCFFL